MPSVHAAGHAFPGHLRDVLRLRERQSAPARFLDERARHRMTRGLVEGRREPQDLSLVEVDENPRGHEPGAAVGQGAGLVDDQDPDLGQRLQRASALDEDADLGRAREAGDQGDGHRQDQRARRGDDQHSERPHGVAGSEPSAAGKEQRQSEEGEPVAVRQPRHGRLPGLRRLDEPDDAGIGAVGRPPIRDQGEWRADIHRAAQHGLVHTEDGGQRLARQAGAIEDGTARGRPARRRARRRRRGPGCGHPGPAARGARLATHPRLRAGRCAAGARSATS